MVDEKIGPTTPKAFISYSWDNVPHKRWVRDLATRIRHDGVDATLDQWHAAPGDELPFFMERSVREADFVILICTPEYKRKSDAREGGVGYEGDIMTAAVLTTRNSRKFIPVLRVGNWLESSPAWVDGKFYVDLRGEPYSDNEYSELVSTVCGTRSQPPPLGSMPGSEDRLTDPSGMLEVSALLDLLVAQMHDMEYVFHTFGESRRILLVALRIHAMLRSRISRVAVKPAADPQLLRSFEKVHSAIGEFLSEARLVLPGPNEDKYTRDRTHLKRFKYKADALWSGVKSDLVADAQFRSSFEALRNESQVLWRMGGFRDLNDYQAFISPHTKDLLREPPSELAIDLLEELLRRERFSEGELVAEGYPKEIVVESLNCLLRDKFIVSEDSGEFRFTTPGARVVRRLLSSRAD